MFAKISSFIKEVNIEMRKVNWPSRQETLRFTMIIVTASVVVAVFLGLVDFLTQMLIGKIL